MVRKFAWTDEEALSILRDYSSSGVHVEITGIIHGVCRDPKDDMVLECAVTSHAEIIVSGDKDHLLNVRTYSGIQVLTAREYLDRFATSPG